MLVKLALIGLGGGVGSVLRALVSLGAARLVSPALPLGTLAVNAAGCFVAGVVTGAVAAGVPMREEVRAALVVGLCGGFTTFSAFGVQTVELAQASARLAALNVAANVVVSVGAAWGGLLLGRAAA